MEFKVGEEIEINQGDIYNEQDWIKVSILQIEKDNNHKYKLKIRLNQNNIRDWIIPNPPLNWGDTRKIKKTIKRNHLPKFLQNNTRSN